jgi:hypothetical protein
VAQLMTASLVVYTKNDIAFTANHIQHYRKWESGRLVAYVGFTCSGRYTEFPAGDIDRIEYRSTGQECCGQCDTRIQDVLPEEGRRDADNS